MLLTLPFLIIVGGGITRAVVGVGWGLQPLPVIGAAVAAAIGGTYYTLAAGALAIAECALFLVGSQQLDVRRSESVAILATAGVTATGVLICRARARRERQLAQVTLVAEAAQRVLLRPVPHQVGAVKLAACYLSAATGARVGGDLYEVVAADGYLRLIVGDVEGKGLPAIQSAASVLGVFREAAHDEKNLTEIAGRIEASLSRELGEEQFVTALFAEIPMDGGRLQLLNCGHPAPLLLGTSRPRFIEPEKCSLPLGLSHLGGIPRIPVTVPFQPGDEVLFYTDGASEARNKAGEFFPLAECDSVNASREPDTLVDRLADEVVRYVGHAPDDDVALLLVYQNGLGPAQQRTVPDLWRKASRRPACKAGP